MIKKVIGAFLFLFIVNNSFSQNGYYVDPNSITLPDTTVFVENIPLPIAVAREDVKSIGMGKTQIANGKSFNAMIYNPALLSRGKFSLDAFSIKASLPPQSIKAATFINDHIEEFRSAFSLKEIWQGVKNFNAAGDIQAQVDALRKIQEGLRFPVELLENVIGNSTNPQTHGIRIVPSIALQVDNFGFTLYGVGQAGFIVQQSPIIEALLDVKLPENVNDPQQLAAAIASLESILNTVIDENEDVELEALPVTYSVSYIDIVGAAGYGRKILPNLSVGGNLKVINRRFSVKRFVTADYNEILNVLKNDFNANITGFTMDLGALYNFDFGLDVGLALQNIIPVQKITSTVSADFVVPYYDYKRDANGNVVLTAQGDTVIQSYNQPVTVGIPFDLKLPFIVSLGSTYPIFNNWDVSFDWYDIAEQDVRFENYADRLRLGTEYRLDAVENKLGVAFRLGLSEGRPTFGLGFNIYKVVQIDGAYAYDNYVGENSIYAQIKVGW